MITAMHAGNSRDSDGEVIGTKHECMVEWESNGVGSGSSSRSIRRVLRLLLLQQPRMHCRYSCEAHW